MARMELAPWMGKQQAPAKKKAAGKKKAPPFGKQAVGSGGDIEGTSMPKGTDFKPRARRTTDKQELAPETRSLKPLGSGGDAAKCPQCGKTMVGGICPACGYTAKKVGSGGDNPLMPDPKLTAANAASSGGRQIRQGAGNWAVTVPEALPKPEISFNKGKRPGVGQAGKPAVGKFGRRKAGSSKSGIAD